MSRAFVREDGNDLAPLPDLPISSQPNFVTARGLAQLKARLAGRQSALAELRARADRLDRLPEAAAERDIRYLEARIKSAIPVPPQPRDRVGFGHRVTFLTPDGHEMQFDITGEDEADARMNRIAPHSPLARALMGAQPGDLVTWPRPTGRIEVEVLRIDQAGD